MTAVDRDQRVATDEASVVDQILHGRTPVVASNREPYSHEYDDGKIAVSRPAGGLTAALDPVMRDVGGTWVAWGSGDADRDAVDDADRVAVPPESPRYDLRRLWLDDELLDGYYYGYSNRVLWPLCHSLPSKIDFEERYWREYRRANEQFATAVVEEAETDDPLVWFHDYHLGLAPAMVRRTLGDGGDLVHFWHIPWPPWDVFRRCPRGDELLAALLRNDVVGFHSDGDRRRFLGCAERALGATVDRSAGVVDRDGRRTHVRTATLPIDAEGMAERARSDAAEEWWRSFAREHDLDDVRVAVGVDRLDYTKGIPARIDALERLWADHPRWRERLTFVQKATESRSRIEAYRAEQRRVAERVSAVNRRFGTDDWQPIVYLDDTLSEDALAGLYRHADVAIVSPLRDGLNLVAKEYVAAQVDDAGALVLSETAGVHGTLGDRAVTVDPLDTATFADAVERALELPPDERCARIEAMRERVHEANGYTWIAELLAPLEGAIANRATDGAREYVRAE